MRNKGAGIGQIIERRTALKSPQGDQARDVTKCAVFERLARGARAWSRLKESEFDGRSNCMREDTATSCSVHVDRCDRPTLRTKTSWEKEMQGVADSFVRAFGARVEAQSRVRSEECCRLRARREKKTAMRAGLRGIIVTASVSSPAIRIGIIQAAELTE